MELLRKLPSTLLKLFWFLNTIWRVESLFYQSECLAGFLNISTGNLDGRIAECRCGFYPGIMCSRWNGEDFSVCTEDGWFCGNVSNIVDAYNSFGTAQDPPLYELAKYASPLNRTRTDVLLGRCRASRSDISAFDQITCVNCSSPSPVEATFLYVVVEFLPTVLVMFLVLFLNLNLTSGFGHSFIFFYQCLPVAISACSARYPAMSYNLYFGRFLWGFLFLEDPIPQLANVEQLPCFTEGQDGYFVRALGYSKVAVVIVVTAILVSCTVCTCCPLQTCRVQYSKLRTSVQRFRRTYVLKGSLLNGIFSLYVLMFGLILKTSFNLLAIGKIYYFPGHNTSFKSSQELQSFLVPRFAGDQGYFTGHHLPYGIVAITILAVFMVIPLLLLCHPLITKLVLARCAKATPRCMKLNLFFDVFQGVFKQKFRFIAGLYFVYRAVLWSLYSFLPEDMSRSVAVLCVLIAILFIHCGLQPFSLARHNFWETLNLLNLLAIAAISQAIYLNGQSASKMAAPMPVALVVLFPILLPVVGVVVYVVVMLCVRFHLKRRLYSKLINKEMETRVKEDESSSDDNYSSDSGSEFTDNQSRTILS